MTDTTQTPEDKKNASTRAFMNAETMMDPAKLHANAMANIHNSRDFGGQQVDQKWLTIMVTDFGLDAAEGKLAKYEHLIGCHAVSLNAIFVDMMVKMSNATDMATIEGFARVALKAQENTRKTVLTLHQMKNPKSATFINNQNNQSLGHMQVNNAKETKAIDKSRNLKQSKNGLLEQEDGERLDFRTAQETGGADPVMATVGKLDGA